MHTHVGDGILYDVVSIADSSERIPQLTKAEGIGEANGIAFDIAVAVQAELLVMVPVLNL